MAARSERRRARSLSAESAAGLWSQTVFFSWLPAGCSVRQKMLYAAAKKSLKSALGAGAVELQAHERADLDAAALVDKCKKVSR